MYNYADGYSLWIGEQGIGLARESRRPIDSRVEIVAIPYGKN